MSAATWSNTKSAGQDVPIRLTLLARLAVEVRFGLAEGVGAIGARRLEEIIGRSRELSLAFVGCCLGFGNLLLKRFGEPLPRVRFLGWSVRLGRLFEVPLNVLARHLVRD